MKFLYLRRLLNLIVIWLFPINLVSLTIHEPGLLNLFAFVVSALSVQKSIRTGSID